MSAPAKRILLSALTLPALERACIADELLRSLDRPDSETVEIKSEQLAYWYLRLNGFLSIPNFVVHPDEGRRQRTDVDLLAVRFPYRSENLRRPMRDDSLF